MATACPASKVRFVKSRPILAARRLNSATERNDLGRSRLGRFGESERFVQFNSNTIVKNMAGSAAVLSVYSPKESLLTNGTVRRTI